MNDRRGTQARIGFCITELEPGGAERCLVELVTRLDRQRFDPVVYCLGPRPLGNPTSLVDVLERAGIPVHCFGAHGPAQFASVLVKLRRRLRADAPQIVQSFLFHANVLGTLAARWAGVPHRVTGIRVAERRARWHLTAARWTDRWVERHVCVSRSVLDFSEREAGLPRHKLVEIANGVDVYRFTAATASSLAAFGIGPARRVITFVGRLDEQKGVSWLVDQMPRIAAGAPDCELLLVGEGPERAALERQVAARSLGERVHFAGFRQDVPEILAASHVCVLTSKWEGMPNALLEAMASGKAVVATDVEGVAEALGPAAAAQVVPTGDAEAFVNKVVAMLNDPAMRTRLGVENQARARQFFSLESMVSDYEQLYASLIGGSRERP